MLLVSWWQIHGAKVVLPTISSLLIVLIASPKWVEFKGNRAPSRLTTDSWRIYIVDPPASYRGGTRVRVEQQYTSFLGLNLILKHK